MADRGAFRSLRFNRCERGFLLTSGGFGDGFIGEIFAFDRIEDLALWLVEQYRDPPLDDKSAPFMAAN